MPQSPSPFLGEENLLSSSPPGEEMPQSPSPFSGEESLLSSSPPGEEMPQSPSPFLGEEISQSPSPFLGEESLLSSSLPGEEMPQSPSPFSGEENLLSCSPPGEEISQSPSPFLGEENLLSCSPPGEEMPQSPSPFLGEESLLSSSLPGEEMSQSPSPFWGEGRVRGNKPIDHLVLFPKLLTGGFIERAFTQVFGLALFRRFRPWAAADPNSSAHMGLGAFNLIRRSAYEKIGTHQKLALEVVDDMTLGRLVKEKRLRQRVMSGVDLVSVRWVGNAGGVVRSLEKNGFAGMDYNIFTLIAATFAVLIFDVLPFSLLFLTRGAAFGFSLGTLICLLLISRAACRKMSGDWRLFWTHPFASLLLLFVLWRSAFLILRAGGVRWRDTFYPLGQLKG